MAEFVWHVSKSGYIWEDVGEYPDRTRNVLATEISQGFRVYKPMERRLLYREFADLGTDPAKYLTFANHYGHLTSGVVVIDEGGYEVDDDVSVEFKWPRKRLDRLGLVVDIELETEREDRGEWIGHSLKMAQLIDQWDKYRRRLSRKAAGDISKTDFGLELVDILNHRVRPVFESSGALSHEPTDLISALYLQLALAVSGNRIHKRCLHCSNWFEVSMPDLNSVTQRRVRSDKQYCSDKCRLGAHYRRNK